MKKNHALSLFTTLIFTCGICTAFLGHSHPGSKTIGWILIVISLIYLFSGWYLFKSYNPGGHPVQLFVSGFIYSSVFIAFSFVVLNWPLAKTLISFAVVWIIIELTLILVTRKTLSKESLAQFLIEAGIMGGTVMYYVF